MYVAMDRKPEHGREIQDAAWGRSGLMLRLRIVTTAAANFSAEHRAGSHGAAVLIRLVQPWAGTDRIVCADSYFASVEATMMLKAAGMRFIGVVKTAHKRFPLASLDFRELLERGHHVSMVHCDRTGRPDMMAVVCVDRERRYFVATASTTQPGTPNKRVRRREMDGGAQRVPLTARLPEVAELFFG